jgi:hypothetical protein
MRPIIIPSKTEDYFGKKEEYKHQYSPLKRFSIDNSAKLALKTIQLQEKTTKAPVPELSDFLKV